MKVASVLAVGGLDPSGGAGLGMDRVTAAARGVWCRMIATTLTAQNGQTFGGSWPVPPEALRAQLDAALDDAGVHAIKIGALPNRAAVEIVGDAVASSGLPTVLDPVLRTSSGGDLIDDEGRQALQERLLPRMTLVTPNRMEAAVLTSSSLADVQADPVRAAHALLRSGARAVLLKGGHDEGHEAVDWLVTEQSSRALKTRRLDTRNARGTGCSLATAIASELALGRDLDAAVDAAKAWFDATFAQGVDFDFGTSPGPLPVLGDGLRERQADGGQGR